MDVTVVVPWRAGCPHREHAWAWVRRRYTTEHPDWVIACRVAPPGPWCKAAAIRAPASGILIIADADVWTDGLPEAVDAVRAGAAWAIPHDQVHRLTRPATWQLTATDPTGSSLPTLAVEEAPYRGVPGGGIIVTTPEVLTDVPMDPRFTGWGQEDQAWGRALRCLHGDPWRGTAPLWHLWHPPAPRLDRMIGSPESRALLVRYHAARSRPRLMRELLAEIDTKEVV